MKEFTCNITREIAVLSENANSWQLELNEVSWNGAAPKLDIRRWKPDRKSGKGVTLAPKEAQNLLEALQKEVAG